MKVGSNVLTMAEGSNKVQGILFKRLWYFKYTLLSLDQSCFWKETFCNLRTCKSKCWKYFLQKFGQFRNKRNTNKHPANSWEYDVPVSALRPKFLWVLRFFDVVKNRFSQHSCLGLNDLFKSMFPDSEISETFKVRILDQLWNCSFFQRCSAAIDKCFSIFCDIVWWQRKPDSAEWADGPTSKLLGRQRDVGPYKIFWFRVSEWPECHKSPHCFICIFVEVVRKSADTNIKGRSQCNLECSGTDRWRTL